MSKTKKKPKTGDVVGWAYTLWGEFMWLGDSRRKAREWKKSVRGHEVKNLRLAKIVLAK